MIGDMQRATVTELRRDTEALLEAAEHRRERRKLKEADLTGGATADPKTFGNPWVSEKDGKRWIDREQFPELMRQ